MITKQEIKEWAEKHEEQIEIACWLTAGVCVGVLVGRPDRRTRTVVKYLDSVKCRAKGTTLKDDLYVMIKKRPRVVSTLHAKPGAKLGRLPEAICDYYGAIGVSPDETCIGCLIFRK